MELSGVTDLDAAYILGFLLAGTGALLILLITCTSVSALLVGRDPVPTWGPWASPR